jgi:histidine ammonia-lyase
MAFPIDNTPLGLAAFVRLARGRETIALTDAARRRLAAAREVVDRYAVGPEPVYGLNTGLGGNLGHRLTAQEMAGFQEQVIRGRTIGMGEPLPEPVCRGALLARILGLAKGAAGISPPVLDLLLDMANRGVTPVIPRRGAIGAGDLGLVAHLAAVAIGRGEAWFDGRRMPGAEALAAVGLSPATLGPKDGLGLLNASPVATAHGAFVLADLSRWLLLGAAAAALAGEGYAANPRIHEDRIAALRPAPGQRRAAALMRSLLAGSGLYEPGAARSIQDALCFRTVAPVLGAAMVALDNGVAAIEAELNGAADNPAVLVESGEMLSTPNFHTPAIALAFDTLAIALPALATGACYRMFKLMNPALSGLPKYLSPVGGGSTGLNSLQKTVAALHGEIRLGATPAGLDTLPVSEGVEDHAPQTALCIAKLERQVEAYAMLVAIEAMVAAQAVDLRGSITPAPLTARLHACVRSAVPRLEADRETGPDAMAVLAALEAQPWEDLMADAAREAGWPV